MIDELKQSITQIMTNAIEIKEQISTGKTSLVRVELTNLRKNCKKLVWSRNSLVQLPDLVEIQEARTSLNIVIKESKKLSSKLKVFVNLLPRRTKHNRTAVIRQKTRILIEKIEIIVHNIENAYDIIMSEPWANPRILERKENKKILIQALKRKGFYHKNLAITLKLIFSINFRDIDFHKENLKGINLCGDAGHNANLIYADFRGADLRGAKLDWADLRYSSFWGANLRGADLSFADLTESTMLICNLRDAELFETNLTRVALNCADLRGADCEGAIFHHATLEGARFGSADLSRAKFYGSKIQHADFAKSNLSKVIDFPVKHIKEVRNLKSAKHIPEYMVEANAA